MLKHQKIFGRSTLGCLLLGSIVFSLFLQRIEPFPLSQRPLKFQAAKSYDYMRRLAKGFPNRVAWGENRIKAGAWLKNEFKIMGYSPKSLMFSEVIAGKLYTNLENIYVEKKGTVHPDEITVIMAHYDITDTTTEGAMDDASGVGVVLELARIFARETTDRTLVFLLTDSEEFGAFWGATAFAQSYEHSDRIVAALNFDFVAPGKQTGILTLCDGLKTGFTPLWLREIALDSLRSLKNVHASDMDGLLEFIERAMQIPPADHGAFLAAGIPALNWVGQTDNFPYVMTHYHHTPYDVTEIMEPESFDSFGKGAERVLRTIDDLPRIPKDFKNSSYWKISERYYLPGLAVLILHILAFIPFLCYSVEKFRGTFRTSTRKQIINVIQNEVQIAGVLFISLLIGYAVMRLLPALKIITLYETFPATQKSLLLYTPNFVAILLVVGSVLGLYFLFKKIFFDSHSSKGSLELRHATHSVLLALIIFLALFKNSFLAVLLLLPPAYFWTAMSTRRRKEDRIMNGLLLLAGSITFIASSILLTTVFHVGVFYWYLFLAGVYGLISTYSVIVFLMAVTVMVRLFRSLVW